MAVEKLYLESFINTSIDLNSIPVINIVLCSNINYGIDLESYIYKIFTIESNIYLEEL